MDDAQLKRIEQENLRLKAAVRELSVLNEITSVLNSTMSVEEITRFIIKKVIAAINSSQAAVFLFSETESSKTPKTFVRDKTDSQTTPKGKLDIQIAGWIARNRKPLVINDISSEDRFANLSLGDESVKTLLAVPLNYKGKLLGALAVFNSHRPERFTDTDARLLSIIGTQSAQVIENARLYQEELKLKELQGELTTARKIQQGFLPKEVPTFSGFDIYGASIPAKEVGGDYYDFITADDGGFFFSIGDVSGKGLPAALLMSTIQGQLRLLIGGNTDQSPGEALSHVNKMACQLSADTQFATMIVGKLTANGEEMALANGGHCFPIIVGKDGSVHEFESSSLLVGMFEEAAYETAVCPLPPGAIAAFASDGIEEAFNEEKQEFGLDRFKEALVDARAGTAREIFDAVTQKVISFRGTAEQSDDLTLLIVKRGG
jgi:sigma-B regulation protein RsbU (phosphoserine phosphatase)